MANKPPLTANDVADWFINQVDREAGETITPLALQKLVYFAQAWYLANKGEPLFADQFQAWAHGPVVRSLFDRFKHLTWEAIPPIDEAKPIKGEARRFLRLVYERYGGYGAKKLEKKTHEKGGPWDQVRGDLPAEARCERVIPNEIIRDFYGEKIGKQWS